MKFSDVRPQLWVALFMAALLTAMCVGEAQAQAASEPASEATVRGLLDAAQVLVWIGLAALGFFGYSVGSKDA